MMLKNYRLIIKTKLTPHSQLQQRNKLVENNAKKITYSEK